MKTYICQICGDAYLGHKKPSDCPFCGAPDNFIKVGAESNPIVNQKIEISELSRKNLLETLDLEIKANAIYLCMAGKAKNYEIKAMYKRLAKVELEHASVAIKLLGIDMPKIENQPCGEEEIENFQKTIALEERATGLYARFCKEAAEQNVKIFFGALTRIEAGHIELIKNYL